uniref:C3H1-type domain-containing protein n=1 Tax=Caenorhabditis tropicalis TaxID=1561998 RepID=A0A1I7T137_9PELO
MTGSEVSCNTSALFIKKEGNDSLDVPTFLNQSQSHVPTQSHISELEKTFPRDLNPLIQQDQLLKTLMSQAARYTLANQDPCTIPDDLRDELMRQKRKDDAFRTALCDSFKRSQTCSYGDQCRFAHGVHQLRLPQHPRGRNHPKYKTVLCDKFSTTGNCKYGTRCQFIHKLVNPSTLVQTSGVLNNTSVGAPTAFNQSLLIPGMSSDLSMDLLNQSLPLRQSDYARAFARADQLYSVSRAVNNQFNRNISSGLRN